MKTETQNAIEMILTGCIDRTIGRVKKDLTQRPFHEALLTKKLVSASSFERSFSTSFGQGPIEEISKVLVIASGAECVRQKETMVNVNKGAVDEIERILSSLRSGDSKPEWEKEVSKIEAFKKRDFGPLFSASVFGLIIGFVIWRKIERTKRRRQRLS